MSAPTGDNSMRAKPSLALATVFLGAVAALTAPADAACKKFGFTVNDYGKEGPTNDAKNLLDKHISEWASQNGVTNYQTGKKNVSCELFIDVILFDEYTCTASATVCWGDDAKKLGQQSADANADVAQDGAKPPAPVSKAAALGIPAQPQQTATAQATEEETASSEQADAASTPQADETTPAAIAAAPHDAEADGPPVALDTAAAPPTVAAAATEAPPAAETAAPGATAPAAVETGALQAGAAMAAPPATPHAAPATATPSAEERAAAAAAAASAAAAAERAAAAAETAANAAKEAAAAAVAASALSKAKTSATVAPLDHTAGAGGAPNAR
ncbi:MAG TPA: hypothetical protein VNR51_08860 [Hyphomicrobium sp.]|nr:hypothetical protein [Hyphomicrobium sp.]